MRDSAGPSAPSKASLIASDAEVTTPREKRPRKHHTGQANVVPVPSFDAAPGENLYFAEFFAGEGGLTKAMQGKGVRCREADELANGGTDFTDLGQIELVKAELRDERTEGASLALHLAPACNTFSHARDRSAATQLRSSAYPEGLPDLDADQRRLVEEASEMALNAFDLAIWAAHDLSASATFESPATSYVWAFLAKLRPLAKVLWKDLTLSQCFFGTKYRKESPSP